MNQPKEVATMTDESSKAHRKARRTILQLSVGAAAAGLALMGRAQQKIAPNLLQYQDKPKNGQQCDQCMHFVPPGSCKIVEGKVKPTGWCSAFAPKPK
jgi:hypothetical protein